MYAIVAHPQINSKEIADFRKKYDPKSEIIAPHITLVFPFSNPEKEDELIHHCQNIVKDISIFPIKLEGTHLAEDDYLYLLVREGAEKLVKLHDKLYEGILSSNLRKDLVYVPHVTIGYFGKNDKRDEAKLGAAYKEINTLSVSLMSKIENVSLVKFDEQASSIALVKQFDLM